MNRKLRPPLRVPWAVLGCCAVVAAIVAFEWSYFAGAAPAPGAAPAAAAAPAALLASYVPPPEERFAEIAQRPLFIPDRRPQQDIEQKPVAPPTAPNLTVQGVVLTTERHYAIIQHGNPPKLDDLAEGDIVDGWKIDRIDADRIALSAGTTHLEYPIGKPPAGKVPGQPPRPAGRNLFRDQ